MHATTPTDLIPLSEAAKLLPAYRGARCHASTVYRMGKAGKLRMFRASCWRVSRQEVLALAEPRAYRRPVKPITAKRAAAEERLALRYLEGLGLKVGGG